MIRIENKESCFVELWRELELTRQQLRMRHKRFTVRAVMKEWFGEEVSDMFVWNVCRQMERGGLDELPDVEHHGRLHRELIRAVVAQRLGVGLRHIDLHALDKAFSTVFPESTPINVNKKKRR